MTRRACGKHISFGTPREGTQGRAEGGAQRKNVETGFVGKEGDAKVELNCLRNASKSKCGGKIDALNKFHFTNMNLLVQDNISVKKS